jgi:DNA-binding HxlR family transcriptional regulator
MAVSFNDRPDVNAASCPSRSVLEHVTSRWGVLVLAMLLDEDSLRFSQLRRAIGGISEKMLAQTLHTLERDGFVDRVARPVIPPHVDYSLTPLGQEAARQVWGLARWVESSLPDVLATQRRYDERRQRDTATAGADAAARPQP